METMELKELLKTNVTYLDNLWSGQKDTTLHSVLSEIKGKKHETITKYLRELYSKGDKEKYSLHKRQLPVTTFCASFINGRKKEHLNKYNSLIVLDIDKLGSLELQRVKEALLHDDYVFSFWESPSKDGIKGLVHLNYNFSFSEVGVDESHKIAFRQLVEYFEKNYNIELDTSGSDFTRLCFISQDTELILKEKVKSFDIEYKPFRKTSGKSKGITTNIKKGVSSQNALFNPIGKNNAFHRKTIKNIIKYLTKNSLSITNSYENWLRVAFAISNSFTFDIGLKYFIDLCILDKDKFDELECKNLLVNCYENSRGEIGFNTIIHLATETGFNYKNINAKST